MPATRKPGKGRKGGGRPPKITEEVVAIVARELKRTAFFTTACEIAGITRQTGYNYLKRGKRSRKGSLLRQFFDVSRKAAADGEMKLVDVLYDDATKNKSAKSAAWLLSHRHRRKYADRVEVKGTLKGKVDHRHLHAVIVHGGETGIEREATVSRDTPALPPGAAAAVEAATGAKGGPAAPIVEGTREWNPARKGEREKRLAELRAKARRRLREEE
jgi:hypothetical protein